jgi:hypothetical protein
MLQNKANVHQVGKILKMYFNTQYDCLIINETPTQNILKETKYEKILENLRKKLYIHKRIIIRGILYTDVEMIK